MRSALGLLLRSVGIVLLAGALALLGWTIAAPRPDAPPQTSPLSAPTADAARFLFWSFQGSTTVFYAAAADSPDRRQSIATVSHREGYPPRASLSPDGRHVAFLLLPPGARERGDAAGLWLLDLATGATQQLLDRGADIRHPPLWSRDGRWVAFRRTTAQGSPEEARFELLALAVDRTPGRAPGAGAQRSLAAATSAEVATLYGVGWGRDAAFYFAAVRPSGTEVWRAADTALAKVATIAQGPARDLRLSPDGQSLAFVVPAGPALTAPSSLGVLDLANGQVRTLAQPNAPAFSPVWSPVGELLAYGTGNAPDAPQARGVARRSAAGEDAGVLPPPPFQGFDVPIAWDPRGRYLAVRALEGPSPDHIVRERLTLIGPDGAERRPVTAEGWVEFVGWLP